MPLVNVMEHRAGERSEAVARATPKNEDATCHW